MVTKGNLSDSEYDMAIGARWAGLCISETAEVRRRVAVLWVKCVVDAAGQTRVVTVLS